MQIEVRGHSGCQVEIKSDDRGLFIQKSTYDKNYLKRLTLQAEKQINASKIEYQYVRVPKIFSVEKTDMSTIIKMEYVYSKNFMEHFEQSGFEQIKYFIKALCLFIEKEIQVSKIEKRSNEVFIKKWNSVESCIKNNPHIKDSRARLLLEKISDFFSTIDEIEIPYGICHGDLTFSNILFNGNNYYLIDFLDSFIESPLIDIVKIRQDSKFEWSQLMYTKPYDKIRLKIISQKIDEQIDSYFCKYEWYKKYYIPFQIMNLLRVLQYAKDENVVTYLINSLEEMV